MKFFITDAFTDKIFGGNPAGIVMTEGGDFPPFDIMKRTAAELRYSETVFVKKTGADTFELRYFTPADEVDLCGHATIAAFSEIGKEFGYDKIYRAITKAGEINIEVGADLIMMEMATPKIIREIKDRLTFDELRKSLGLSPLDIADFSDIGTSLDDNAGIPHGVKLGDRIAPAIVSTGLPDIMMPVNSIDELNSISPDFEAVTQISKRENVVGIHAFALSEDEQELSIHCRNFAPLYEIDEEAATGTSNGALTYYLFSKGLVKPGEIKTIMQGEAMDRPSKISAKIEMKKDGADNVNNKDEANVIAKVGGSAVTLASGEIFI